MRARHVLPSLNALATLAGAAPAGADELVHPVQGARHLAAVGGHAVWAQPDGDRFRLAVRRPDGTVVVPPIRSFAVAPDPTAGVTAAEGPQRLVALYPRCAGRSAVRGCDVFRLQLATGREERVARVSTAAGSEVAAVQVGHTVVVARRGGARPGLVAHGRLGVRRLSGVVPAELAWESTVLAARERGPRGQRIVVRSASGDFTRVVADGLPAGTANLEASRYRAFWTQPEGGRTSFWRTTRFFNVRETFVERGGRTLPGAVRGMALTVAEDGPRFVLTASGLVRLAPEVRF